MVHHTYIMSRRMQYILSLVQTFSLLINFSLRGKKITTYFVQLYDSTRTTYTSPLHKNNTHHHQLRHRKSHAAAPGAALFGVSTKIEIKYGKVATLCGMEPINLLFCKYNVCRLVFPAKKVGMHPVNELA